MSGDESGIKIGAIDIDRAWPKIWQGDKPEGGLAPWASGGDVDVGLLLHSTRRVRLALKKVLEGTRENLKALLPLESGRQFSEYYQAWENAAKRVPKEYSEAWKNSARLLYHHTGYLAANYTFFEGSQKYAKSTKKGFIYSPMWMNWKGDGLGVDQCSPIWDSFGPMGRTGSTQGAIIGKKRYAEQPFVISLEKHRSKFESSEKMLLITDGEMSFRIIEMAFLHLMADGKYREGESRNAPYLALLKAIGVVRPDSTVKKKMPTARALRLALWIYYCIVGERRLDSESCWPLPPVVDGSVVDGLSGMGMGSIAKNFLEACNSEEVDCEKCGRSRKDDRKCASACGEFLDAIGKGCAELSSQGGRELSHVTFNILGHYALRRCPGEKCLVDEILSKNNVDVGDGVALDVPWLDRGLIGFRLFSMPKPASGGEGFEAFVFVSSAGLSRYVPRLLREAVASQKKRAEGKDPEATPRGWCPSNLESFYRNVGSPVLLKYYTEQFVEHNSPVFDLGWREWRALRPSAEETEQLKDWKDTSTPHHLLINSSKSKPTDCATSVWKKLVAAQVPEPQLNRCGYSESNDLLKDTDKERREWPWRSPSARALVIPRGDGHDLSWCMLKWTKECIEDDEKLARHVEVWFPETPLHDYLWFNVPLLLHGLNAFLEDQELSKYRVTIEISEVLVGYSLSGMLVKIRERPFNGRPDRVRPSAGPNDRLLMFNEHFPWSKEPGNNMHDTMRNTLSRMAEAGVAWIAYTPPGKRVMAPVTPVKAEGSQMGKGQSGMGDTIQQVDVAPNESCRLLVYDPKARSMPAYQVCNIDRRHHPWSDGSVFTLFVPAERYTEMFRRDPEDFVYRVADLEKKDEVAKILKRCEIQLPKCKKRPIWQ